jgi:GDP-L-fucose synthase
MKLSKKDSRIYVSAHEGLVGSAIVRILLKAGYTNILTRTHQELDLLDTLKTREFFERERPEYVFCAAAKVGGIWANQSFPADFIYQNIMIQTNVIDLSYRYGVKRLIFFGSSCSYPKFAQAPIKESDLLKGQLEPTSEPYAVAKIAGIKLLEAYNRQHSTDFVTLIPSNLYGKNDHAGQEAHVVAALIERFHLAKLNKDKNVIIWGSGRARRDFLYVDDLARAALLVMEAETLPWDIINVATGVETSIKDLAFLIKKIVGFEGEVIFDRTKPDGIPSRLLDISRILSFGWKPEVTLEGGIRLTYEWYRDFVASAKQGKATVS